MQSKKKVVIVEDHRLFREGLKSMLAANEAIVVIGEARDGLEAVKTVRRLMPDLLLLDLSMPRMNGISVINEIRSQFPDLKILVLTIHESDQYVLEAFKAGANGYCIKDASRRELLSAIGTVLEGKVYICPGIADEVMDGYLKRRSNFKEKSKWDTITPREKEVLKLVAEGYMNKQIADFLNISKKTVEKHRANIMGKLNLHNASALTAYAIDKRLVDPKV